MTSKIFTELLIIILNNVQSTQDLYSSLLVNRIWCKIAMPILWKFPLGQECCWWDYKKLRKEALCIRTYISCMDSQTRTLLIQNGFDLSLSSPQTTFDYSSFTHEFIINNLVYFISIYSQQIIVPDQDNDNNNNSNNEIIITKSRILFREMCKLIIARCSFLDYFKLARVPTNFETPFLNFNDLIGSILKLHGAPKVFKKLESFSSMTENYEMICPLYESLTLICDNILNMDLELYSHSQVQLLANLISVQKHLENLSIVDNSFLDHPDYNSIFWAIISQKETLKSLRLYSVSFYDFKGKSSSIEQFISLQDLYMDDCYGLQESDCLLLVSSFTQLSRFYFLQTHGPQEFIIKILETANTNLKDIYLDLCSTITFDIFSTILNYCTKINDLTLHNLSLEQVIAIFNNNFNELRRFSFYCGGNANELLCQMAENLPKSLETIEIGMGVFSADSLRKFFEVWCCKEGEGIKKMIVCLPGQARVFTLSEEHLKVIEEYGVQFDIEGFQIIFRIY